VREIAELPGLLARVDLSDVAAIDAGPAERAPETLLPRLLAVAQADRFKARRQRFTLMAVAACLALLAAVAVPMSILGLGRGGGEAPPQARNTPSAPATQQAMKPVSGEVPVKASLSISDAGWGTAVALRCRYDSSPYLTKQDYGLWAVPKAGKAEQVGSWTVAPGEEITMSGTTKYNRSQLAALEIRRANGKPVLRTTL
jgi:hypothetical protein